MPGKTDNLLPDARDVQRQAAAKAAKKANDYVRVLAEAELEKRALTERLGTASAASEDDKIKLASAIIRRAAQSGLGEVQLYRFSDSLCTRRRPRHQQECGGLGNHAQGSSKGYLRYLGELHATAWIPDSI
jgi:hypothetical protein